MTSYFQIENAMVLALKTPASVSAFNPIFKTEIPGMSILQKIGAHVTKNGACEFTVWAPSAKSVSVEITVPKKQTLPLEKREFGYWKATLENASPETRYFINLNHETKRPDPASLFQTAHRHIYATA